jgi:hypothetical protein
MKPLAVALVSGGLGLLLCVQGPDGIVTGVAAGTLTFVLATLGLWIVCRRDFVDLVRLLFRALRSALPRLRRHPVAAA